MKLCLSQGCPNKGLVPDDQVAEHACCAVDGWLTIESAPKDGRQFLIWTKRLGFAVVTHDKDNPMDESIVPSGHHLHVDDGKFGPYPIRGDYPTHWQPLPEPPK